MEKKIIMISLLGAVVLASLIAGAIALRKNDLTALNRDHTWYVEYDTAARKDLLVQGSKLKSIKGDINKMIIALNKATFEAESAGAQGAGVPLEPPTLRLQSVAEGIAHVEIIGAEYLTQRMGTSGAQNYLAAATYSLTEAPGVRGVDFVFPVGDHAAPGVYTRESFRDYVIVAR
ncbi:MAG: hypothetical protein AABZ15_03560 [Nitrospirota bacterium]